MKFTCIVEKTPIQDRQEWLRLRKLGFGGSDIGMLYEKAKGLDGYGCARYMMIGKIFNLPEETNPNIERGVMLEEPVAKLYASKRPEIKIETIGRAYIKEVPYIFANADRIQLEGNEKSLVEIKCPSRHSFRNLKKNGLPTSYICQAQWQMLCYGVNKLTFVIYCADSHEMEWFEINRDNQMIEELINFASIADKEINKLLPKDLTDSFVALEPYCKDKDNCDKCSKLPESGIGHKPGKKGVIFMDPIADSIISDYLITKEEIKKLEEVESCLKEEILQMLTDSEKGETNAYRVSNSEQSRESASAKEVRATLDKETADKIIRTTKFNVLRVTPKENK